MTAPLGRADTARTRLEAWLVARGEHLATPVLDVGTARAARRWMPQPRVTLDYAAHPTFDLAGDIEHLDAIATGAFGSVVCTEVLEHVRRPDLALRELRRVTAPGGTLLLSVPWLYPFHPCPLDLRRFTLQGLVLELETAGWTVIEAEGLPIPAEAHAHLVAAIKLITGGKCPHPESLAWSNWCVRAVA
jgi:SAM-dependent methyltransferase